MNLNNLKNALEKIIFELNANGKHESAKFFQTRYDQIIVFRDKIPFKTIESLSSCRAMGQYANFSVREEELLDDVVNYAFDIKKMMPRY